jgi:hypothetical protein
MRHGTAKGSRATLPPWPVGLGPLERCPTIAVQSGAAGLCRLRHLGYAQVDVRRVPVGAALGARPEGPAQPLY